MVFPSKTADLCRSVASYRLLTSRVRDKRAEPTTQFIDTNTDPDFRYSRWGQMGDRWGTDGGQMGDRWGTDGGQIQKGRGAILADPRASARQGQSGNCVRH